MPTDSYAPPILTNAARAELLSTILDITRDALIGIDQSQHIIFFNQGAEQLLGYDAAEVIGGSVEILLSPLSSETHHKVIRDFADSALMPRVVAEGQRLSARRKDGTDFAAEATYASAAIGGQAIFIVTLSDINEREKEESETEQLFRLALDLMCIAGFDGYFKRLNLAWEKTLGWTISELMSKPYIEFVHPDDREATAQAAGMLVDGKLVFTFENRYLCKDGDYKWISWDSYPSAENGQIFAIARDVTASKQMEQGLRQLTDELELRVRERAAEYEDANASLKAEIAEREQAEAALRVGEARFRGFLDSAPDAMVIVNKNGQITLTNIQVERIFGYTQTELLGQGVEILIPERFHIRHPAHRDAFFSNPHMREMGAGLELYARRKDGSEFPVEISLSHHTIDDEVVALSTIRDITERKESEDRLLRSESQLSKALRLARLGTWEWNADSNTVEWSSELYRIHGVTPQEFDVNSFNEFLALVHPEDREGTMGSIQQALLEKRPFTFDYRIVRPDGAERFIQASVDLNVDNNGHITHLYGVTRDITESKEAEQERIARQTAEQASAAKSRFLSRMSHELRTPLNSILGFAQLLEMSQSEPLTPTQQTHAESILKAGSHLLELINEVLEISRIEAGQLALSTETVNLNQLVAEVLDLIEPLAAARRIHIQSKCGSTEPIFVTADRQRLKQVLINLLSNAVKYNSESGRIWVGCQTRPNGQVRIRVRDSGPGISSENQAKIFQPFERLGAEQSGVEGSGLGLALSKHLVTMMGGEMGVESIVGAGATFWLELPSAEPQLKVDRENGVTAPLHSLAEYVHTILYIEDNHANYELVHQALAEQNHVELVWAMQGGAGLELARQCQPDLILLDLHLQDMHGSAVLDALRQDEITRTIPAIVISADATPGQIKRLRAAGADAYLTKPLDIRKFLNTVTDLLKRRAP